MCDLVAKCPKPLIEMRTGATALGVEFGGQTMSDLDAGVLCGEACASSTKESQVVQLTVFYSVEYSRERCWGT
jgi:hypothetical protein